MRNQVIYCHLFSRDLFFVIFSIAIQKNREIKGPQKKLPWILTTRKFIPCNNFFYFFNATLYDYVAFVLVFYFKFRADTLELFLRIIQLRKCISKMLTFVLLCSLQQTNLSTCFKFCFVRVPYSVTVKYGFAKLYLQADSETIWLSKWINIETHSLNFVLFNRIFLSIRQNLSFATFASSIIAKISLYRHTVRLLTWSSTTPPHPPHWGERLHTHDWYHLRKRKKKK